MKVWALAVVVVALAIVNTSAIPHQHHQHFPNKRQAEYVSTLGSYEVVTPRRVNSDGTFLTHHLYHAHTPATRTKRHAHVDPYHELDLHYMISLDGKDHQVTLRANKRFLAPHAVVERRRGGHLLNGSSYAQVIGTQPSCHYHGYVRNHTVSRVALSTCQGLTGYVRTDHDEYLIEPVRDHAHTAHDRPHPHVVYRRSALPSAHVHTCSTPDAHEKALHARAQWEDAHSPYPASLPEEEEGTRRRRRRRKRSVSVERNVEVTVVADKKMVDFYSNEDINTYILTVMNMVSSVYHDASIGNAVNIYVVRIMLLEDPQYEEELDISHNADDTLRSFCHWQQMINPGNETHPYHHDVAVLITRFNICSRVTDRCATLGVSEIAGMCQPLRSCNVNEDTGLQIAYTIAHELGHNFGMNHDGPQNGCESQYGSTQHVMSPHLTNDANPVTWSNCSREEITHFLDRDWGACLEDEPPAVEYTFPELPPGAMYDADHQCRLSFGADATHCEGIEGVERVCQTLWCHLDNRCITRMEPAAEGTQCGKYKWCASGECVTMGERPAAIHGNWGMWSSWSSCSRTCGAGVASAQRHCDNPAPANGGRYCTGDRKRYRICNTQECPENGVSFRAIQCSEHDDQPYKGENHTWLPVMFDQSPCQLDCKPDNEFYSVKLRDTVMDGTPCKPGTRDMCIHGVCKRVACDWTIDGVAQEDRCGLCHGDGTQCVTTRGVFNVTRNSGYVPAVTFPRDARNVKVRELHDAANYLAIRDNVTGKYFLNGNWIIHWSGEYSADGTMMYYSREGETENLFLPGPLKRPLTLMLLFQTENPGLAWEYTLPHQNATYTPTFDWHHSDWSICTVTCGGGTQVSKVQCMEKEAGLVEEQYCSNQSRPEDLSRPCNNHACPAWWWSGPWQPCAITCGSGGIRRRTVICVRSFGPTEQMALLDSACDETAKPHETEVCPTMPHCPKLVDWSVGPWSQSCILDPCEYEEREVLCVAPQGNCDPLSRPPDRRQCGNITCGVWEVGSWSKCSASCGEGVQFRRVSCEGGLACREIDEPKSVQECAGSCLEEETFVEIDDVLVEEPSSTRTSVPTSTTTGTPPGTTYSTISTTSPPTTTVTPPTSTTHTTSESYSATTTDPANSGPPLSEPTTTVSTPAGEITKTPTTESITEVPTLQSSTVDEAVVEPVSTFAASVIPTTLPLTTTVPTSSTETRSTSVHEIDSPSYETTTEPQSYTSKPTPTTTPQPSTISGENDPSSKNESIQEGRDDEQDTHTHVKEGEKSEDQNEMKIVGTTEATTETTDALNNEEQFVDGQVEKDTSVIEESSVENTKIQDTISDISDDTLESHPEIGNDNLDNLESLNEVDVDSESVRPSDPTVTETVDSSNESVSKPGVSESELHPSSDRGGLPSTTPVAENIVSSVEPTGTEEPTEVEGPTEVAEPTDVEPYTTMEKHSEMEKHTEMDISSENRDLVEKKEPQEEEERPDGIIEDKIDVEDFEVIEIIELPPKGKKKKNRKKVLLHTGAEAVDVLHDLAEEQAAKKTAKTHLPDVTVEYTVPKYRWNVSHWSECNAECGGGVQRRSAVCIEVTTDTVVDPHHCLHPVPENIQDCNTMACGEWMVGEWGECSSSCDVGERVRPVECPEGEHCPFVTRPPEVEPCDLGPCVQWVEGPWSLCTKSCGGGYQIRHVKCVDVRTQEAARSCPREAKPKHKMACHNERCPKNRRGQQRRCRDRLDTKLCKRLKHMCSTKFFRVKCCRTCLRRAA